MLIVGRILMAITLLMGGLGCNNSDEGRSLVPSTLGDSLSCEDPAPLTGDFDPCAPGYFVYLDEDVDLAEETARLAAEYGFIPHHILTLSNAFTAELTDEAVGSLRCEPTVTRIAHDGCIIIDDPIPLP